VRRQSAKPDAADRLLKSLGLAARAGRVRIGMDATCQALETGRATAIVIAGDAPSSVRERLCGKLRAGGLPVRVVLDGDALGHAIGRARVVALAVTDESLGRRVIELAEAVSG
jgi:ribosomal protein L7Ae-like RNA K-turn-binding protein